MKYQIILWLLFTFFFSFSAAQNQGDIPPNAISSKCYAKCQLLPKPETIETSTSTYPVYIGKDYNRVKLKTIKHTLSEKNGIIESIDLMVVKKPKKVPATDIVYQTYETHLYIEARSGGYTEWIEVLCEDTVSKIILRKIQKELRTKGYDPGPDADAFGDDILIALAKYQKDNHLPIGHLDFKTLDALGIFY